VSGSAEVLRAPFPYFGGKRRAAPLIWNALGDPGGYVEPFAGSAAVLLARPAVKGRRVETINDADGWLVNMWRAIQQSPEEVAMHAAGPVTEIDYHARLAWLHERRGAWLIPWLEGDPENHDAKAAGWWLYVMACGIADPFGGGPWRVIDGRLVDTRKLPHLGDPGRGVNRKLPHLGDPGQGVNRELPHLGNPGRGVNRELPHLGNPGQGVNRELPHLGNPGQGLIDYMRRLAARLARVRITCGSWERVLTPAVVRAKTGGDGGIGILLDPPYSTSGHLYAHGDDDGALPADVRSWCLTAPEHYRIALCGYDGEHAELEQHGWRVVEGKSGGGAGYSTDGTAGHRERLWLSPACIGTEQEVLFT